MHMLEKESMQSLVLLDLLRYFTAITNMLNKFLLSGNWLFWTTSLDTFMTDGSKLKASFWNMPSPQFNWRLIPLGLTNMCIYETELDAKEF